MDRRLLTIACVALILEFLLFLGDVGVLPFSLWKSSRPTVEQARLGEIQTVRRNVRRRGFDSSIWEDSTTKDFVYENDSVLTLSDSSAKLKLRGGIHLELQENTLVVLETANDGPDKPFRVRFSRGDFRGQSGGRDMQVGSGEWVITASSGSDLSVRAVDSQRVELEVHSGDAHVSHAVHGQVRELGKDQRLILFPEEAGAVVASSKEISWADPRPQRVYAHEFPVRIPLIWNGEPEQIEILTPAKGTETIKLKGGQGRIEHLFSPGSHHLTLQKGKEISRTLPLQVMRAPKMIHLTPLPRDRVKTNSPVLFAWLSEIAASNYRVELSPDKEFKSIAHAFSGRTPRLETGIPAAGDFNWRVIAFDEDGFMIPAAYSYPVISHPDPLAPPLMRAPTATEPDDEARRTTILKWLEAGWRLLFPVAEGQLRNPPPPVIFNWDAVPGADFYVIEISPTADFSNPEVIAKVSTNTYAWGNFTKRVYFYRVAGGSKGGRVGYFSPPERIDLTNWPPSRPKRTADADPVQAPVVSPPKAAPPRTTPPPIVRSAPPPPALTAAPPPVEHERRLVNGRIWWRGTYTTTQEAAPDSVKSSRGGAAPLGLGLEIESAGPLSVWRLGVDAHQFTWKAKDEIKWPFQAEQTGIAWSARAYHARSSTGFAYGVALGQSPMTTRKDYEEVEVAAEFHFGPSIAAYFGNGGTSRSHALSLGYSPDLISAILQNHWRWHFGEKYFAGFQGDFTYGAGDGRSLISFDLGAQLGVSW